MFPTFTTHDAFRRVALPPICLHFDLSFCLVCLDQREYDVQHAFDHFFFAGFANRAERPLQKWFEFIVEDVVAAKKFKLILRLRRLAFSHCHQNSQVHQACVSNLYQVLRRFENRKRSFIVLPSFPPRSAIAANIALVANIAAITVIVVHVQFPSERHCCYVQPPIGVHIQVEIAPSGSPRRTTPIEFSMVCELACTYVCETCVPLCKRGFGMWGCST